MPALLHEYWENEDGGEFGRVNEHNDRLRPTLMPGLRKASELRASSWNEAMRLRNEQLGYEEYVPVPGLDDYVYSEEEAAEQEAYLAVRDLK